MNQNVNPVFSGAKREGSNPPSDLEALAISIARGSAAFPIDRTSAETAELSRRVREIRRVRLVRFLALAIATDLVRPE